MKPLTWPQVFQRIVLFGLGTLAVVLAFLIVLAFPQRSGITLAQRIRPELSPQNGDYKIERFREALQSKPVDLIFMGSSHCYRSFDPRLFRAAGYTSFNLGTSAQSPIATLHLYREFRRSLRPRLVVYEAFPVLFDVEGIEDFYRQTSTLAPRSSFVGMAWNFKDERAFQALTINALKFQFGRPLPTPLSPPQSRYIPGGFVESWNSYKPENFKSAPRNLKLRANQLTAFTQLLREIRADGVPVVVVIQPVLKSYRAHHPNYDSMLTQIAAVARREATAFVDYGYAENLGFTSHKHYLDDDHLNLQGVRIFNALFLQSLVKLGLQSSNLGPRREFS